MIHVVHFFKPSQGQVLPACILPLLLEGDNPEATVQVVLNTEDSRLAAEWANAFAKSNEIDLDGVTLTRAEARRGDFPGLQHFPFPLHSVQAYFLPEVSVRQQVLNLEQPF